MAKKDKLGWGAGSASVPGQANTLREKYANGSISDPSIPANNPYRPCDGAILPIPLEDLRVQGSPPGQDPRDPNGPKTG